MRLSLPDKVLRYKGLLKEVSNWPSYLLYKARQSHQSFTFKLRNANSILVPKQMLPPFKEIFFDQVYLQGIPKRLFQKEELTIVDIGANVGFFSVFMLFRHPKAKVYAFEPMPYNFSVLEEYKKEAKLSNLFPVNKAVAGSLEKLSLNYADSSSFTTMASIFKNKGKAHSLEVDTTTLEQIVQEQALPYIDFIKIDCEGSEYGILYKNSAALFQKINAMCIETHPGQKENENITSLAAFLQEQGYHIITKESERTGYIWAWRSAT